MDKAVLDDFVPHIVGFMFQKCSPGWHIQPRTVDEYDMTYIVKGNARYVINGVTHEVASGDLLLLNEGDLREAVTSSQNLMQCYVTRFKTNYQESENHGVGGILFPNVSHIGLRPDVIDLFKELSICWVEQQPGYVMKSRALFMLIISRLSEIVLYHVEPVAGDYRVNKVVRYITRHYRQKLMVKDLAARVNIDSDYLGTLFKRETGMHINDYIKKIRIDHAEDMLRSGKYKVSEVSEYCGFCDIVHFFRSFKSLRGFPPSRCIPNKYGVK
jgi:AraC-like DNA-binding protein